MWCFGGANTNLFFLFMESTYSIFELKNDLVTQTMFNDILLYGSSLCADQSSTVLVVLIIFSSQWLKHLDPIRIRGFKPFINVIFRMISKISGAFVARETKSYIYLCNVPSCRKDTYPKKPIQTPTKKIQITY